MMGYGAAVASTGRQADFRRFIVAGVVNTTLTSAVYFAGLLIFSPTVSYAVAWLAGLGFVMVFYPDHVFVGGARSMKARLWLGAVTVGVFLIGALVLRGMIDLTGDARIAFLITLLFTTVLNFLSGRTLLRKVH